MTLTQTTNGNELTIAVEGRLDIETSPKFREVIKAIPSGIDTLILDMKELTYISSAGIRELVSCCKRYPEDQFFIRNVQPNIFEIFKMTGFSSLVEIELAE